ncbi:transmembrane amino acid transporter protein-domain-containing protein [Tuber borchii]|uniref:Transmembrane amino acid transporter protein-domain-containing protein n=1 Tax=Tuber borchii TaxID=42251 RepID=A0A2T6ZTP0_TUBBO|nr:transmembrane amino acid transporter protein-domain-containing protein [Tuber borchii]
MSSANYESITQEDRDEGTSSPEGRRRRRQTKIAHPAGEASWGSSVVNLLNTIVGAGVLAMPHAMSQFGMALGVFVILFSGFMSGFALYLQTRCAKYIDRGTASFFTLSQLTFPNAAVVFDLAIAIKCFGVAISYLIIIGDLMPQVILGFNQNAGNVECLVDRHFWITGYMLVIIPLSFLRRLDSLKYTSFVALVSIGYLIIIVLAHFLKGGTLDGRGDVRLITWAGPIEALSSFPVIVFAYTCHQNMFSILNEIKDVSHESTLNVILGSIGSASSIYVLVAITGYLSYGDNIGGNIIAMYPSSWTSTIGRAAIVILVMFSYPLQAHPCRASIDNILKWKPFQRRVGLRPPSPGRVHEMSDWRFALITTAIIVGTYLVAMTVSSLERVLAYVGSTGSTSISFILPGLFYWKISNPESDNHRLLKEDEDSGEEGGSYGADTWRSKLLRRGALGLAIYGFVVMITCLTLNTFYVVAH